MAEKDTDAVNTEYNLLFPVVPFEEDTVAADATGLYLVDDIAEFGEDARENETAEAPEGLVAQKTLAIDWTTGELYSAFTGAPLVVEDEATLVEWTNAILATPAGVYPIFDPRYGNRILDILGAGLPNETLYSEIARFLREALEQSVYINAVEVLAIRRLPDVDANGVFVTVSLDTVYSDTPIQLDLTT